MSEPSLSGSKFKLSRGGRTHDVYLSECRKLLFCRAGSFADAGVGICRDWQQGLRDVFDADIR